MAIPNDNCILPLCGLSNGQHSWFDFLSLHRQSTTPMLNPSFREKGSIGSPGNSNELSLPDWVNYYAQESFLVLDQTGDQTTVIFSSEMDWNLTLPSVDNLVGNQPGSDQILINKVHEESEMHEDSEELDALLYSDEDDSEELDALFYSEEDDSDFSDDEEVTSKDRTLCTTTFHDSQELFRVLDEPHSGAPYA